ncbi:transmembrane anchored protein [Microvirga sp. KLBC 81]|nr:transmembrane anchored protein [Microvirga sp. KLBC 81]
MKLLTAFAFGAAFVLSPLASISSAKACTNSYDTAKDGSNCGGRAAGCKQGGRSGYC